MNPLHQILMALAGGVIAPFCFPPFSIWPLMVISLAALFKSVQGLSPRPAFYLGLTYGFVSFSISLRWFFEIFSLMAVVLYLILAFFIGLFCALIQCRTAPHHRSKYRLLFMAILWTGIEFYRCELFYLQFPWITPGTSIGPIWLTPLLGVYGATFLVAFGSAALIDFPNRKLTASVLIALIALMGLWRPGAVNLNPSQDRIIHMALIQSESSVFSTYLSLSKSIIHSNPDWIVWPEYAVPYDVRNHPEEMAKLHDLCDASDSILTLGTQTAVGNSENDWKNTALTLDHERILGEYYKARPVHFFNDGIQGKSFHCIETVHGKIGTPVCFDGDGSEVIRKIAENGAELFVVPIYDAEHWTELQHLQHAALFQIRASETGRWFACASSSGVTQLIDPNGKVISRFPMFQEGTLAGKVSLISEKTIYVKAGWIFPWITLALTCMFILSLTIQFIRAKRRPQVSAVSRH